MREILFRGKKLDDGEWITGYYTCFNGKEHRIYDGYAETDCGDYYPDWWSVDPDTMGQYTGLTDKNGKEIFEGDICQIKNHRLITDTPFVVEWEDFVYNGWTWRDLDDDGSVDSFTSGAANYCEIIGNIHDNPELLEG